MPAKNPPLAPKPLTAAAGERIFLVLSFRKFPLLSPCSFFPSPLSGDEIQGRAASASTQRIRASDLNGFLLIYVENEHRQVVPVQRSRGKPHVSQRAPSNTSAGLPSLDFLQFHLPKKKKKLLTDNLSTNLNPDRATAHLHHVINWEIPQAAQVPTSEAEIRYKLNTSSASGFRAVRGCRLQLPVTAPSPNHKEPVVPPLGRSPARWKQIRFSAHRLLLKLSCFQPYSAMLQEER